MEGKSEFNAYLSDEDGNEIWDDVYLDDNQTNINMHCYVEKRKHESASSECESDNNKPEQSNTVDLEKPKSNLNDTNSSTDVLMKLNDNKAGMTGLDKERINKIITDASRGSKFYENELKKEERIKARIEKQKKTLEAFTEQQRMKALKEADALAAELEAGRDLSRTIVHIDMDAFYAAVEMRDSPELKDKPMAVGGNDMLSTSNYHARRYGVRAAMPGFIARKLCPQLVIVPCNFDKYRAVSDTVQSILTQYDPDLLCMSLDEAYLDLTEHLAWRRDRDRQEVTTQPALHNKPTRWRHSSSKGNLSDRRLDTRDLYIAYCRCSLNTNT